MPVSAASMADPFRGSTVKPTEEPKPKRKRRSKTPQLCVLTALMPTHPKHHPIDWPVLNRAALRVACGLSPKNTMNRLINGDSSGKGARGLISAGLIEAVPIDVDGLVEMNYRITTAGIEEYRRLTANA